jgi:hypothetical protein
MLKALINLGTHTQNIKVTGDDVGRKKGFHTEVWKDNNGDYDQSTLHMCIKLWKIWGEIWLMAVMLWLLHSNYSDTSTCWQKRLPSFRRKPTNVSVPHSHTLLSPRIGTAEVQTSQSSHQNGLCCLSWSEAHLGICSFISSSKWDSSSTRGLTKMLDEANGWASFQA